MLQSINEHFSRAEYPIYVQNMVLLALPVIAGLLVRYILGAIAHRKARQTNNYSLFRSMIQHLSRPVSVWLPLLFIKLTVPVMTLSSVWERRLEKILDIALIITFAWILINIVNIGRAYAYHRYDISKQDNFHERKIRTQLQVIQRIISGAIIFVAIAFVLLSFEGVKKIGAGLLTGVGIGGVIIGLAAQRSLGNLFAGLHIAFTQPIRIDDVVIVEGEYGNVEEITLSYVVVRIWDNRRLVMPLTYFLEKPFENWTRSSAELLTTVFIYTDYSISVEAVRNELTRLLHANAGWNKKTNSLVVYNAGESTLQLRALISADNSGNASDLQYYVREGLIGFIKQNCPGALPQNRVSIQNSNSTD